MYCWLASLICTAVIVNLSYQQFLVYRGGGVNCIINPCVNLPQVLKPVQAARLMVQSYPSKPDMLAVASAVAIECGEDVMVPPEPGKPIPFLPSGVQNSTNLLEGPVPMGLLGCGTGLSEDASSTPESKMNTAL